MGFHAFGIQAGFIGVDFFFVISGYLISSIIFKEARSGKVSILDFYRRRIRRIFPALLTVLTSCFVLGWFVLLADEYEQLNKHVAAGLAFVSNLVLLSESGYFDSASTSKILLHLWSLGIEEQFYILWPILILLFAQQKIKLRNWLIALLVASFALNIAMIGAYPSAAFYLPFTRFWELLLGAALAYRVVVDQKSTFIFSSANFNSLLGLALLIAANIFINDRSAFPGWWALLPTLSAILFISAGPHAWFNQHVLASRALVWVGLISYPLYLWHWPLLTFARILDGGRQPASSIRIAMVLLAILLAWLTYRFIEKPIRFNKKSWFTPARLLFISCFLILIAGYTFLNHGLPNRSAAQLKILNAGDVGHDEFRNLTNLQNNYCVYQRDNAFFCDEKLSHFSKQIAIVGDSHAEQLALGLTSKNPSVGFVLFDTNQTLPFLSSPQSQKLLKAIAESKKIEGVILAAYWNLRAPQIASPNQYQEDIISTANYLSSGSKRVYVVFGIPNFTFLPTKCKFDWPFLRVQQCNENQFFETQYLCYATFFYQASLHSKANLIDLKSAFCQGNTCSMAKNGELLFRDDNHLGIHGSILVGKIISSKLFQNNSLP